MASVFKKKGRSSYTILWFDHTGKRREKSSKTADKRAAERIANELEAKDIFEIAKGEQEGDRAAALKAYEETGRALGDTVANVLTFTDGVAVIGGGITGASDLYMPALMEELNFKYKSSNAEEMPRLVQRVFNLDENQDRSDRAVAIAPELDIGPVEVFPQRLRGVRCWRFSALFHKFGLYSIEYLSPQCRPFAREVQSHVDRDETTVAQRGEQARTKQRGLAQARAPV